MENGDVVYGKIDAMLGRRSGEMLLPKAQDNIDFPTLTEVVVSETSNVWSGVERRSRGQAESGRRIVSRPNNISSIRMGDYQCALTRDEVESLLVSFETRIGAMINNHITAINEILKRPDRSE